MTTDEYVTTRIEHAGHTFDVTYLAWAEHWSVRCTDLAEGEDASEVSWPTEDTVSAAIGRRVRFVDQGCDITEAVYRAR